jgi:hypothetical protein
MFERCRDEVVAQRQSGRIAAICLGWLATLWLTGCAGGPLAGVSEAGREAPGQESPRFVVSFPAEVHPEPVTARVLLFFSRSGDWEPRYASSFFDPQPVYAIDVNDLHPGTTVAFSPERFRAPDALAFPRPLDRLDAGTYYVQALIDLDQTRPDFDAGPGNLYSRVVRCELTESKPCAVELVANRVIEAEVPPADTEWVKLVEVRSKLLSEFHGREVKLRAAVILPVAYGDQPDRQFATVYTIPGFSGDHTSAWVRPDVKEGQMLRVILDPQVPLGHSVFANSANNGPVGEALVEELIPEIERRFRAVPHAYGRFLMGHSSGGWACLWLQVTYHDFFGGCWSLAPDPVDFRHFQTMNIYEDHNGHWTREGYPRPLARREGQVAATFGQVNRWEYVVGYGYQLDSFNAVFSPRGEDGRPRPLMDKLTGAIDPEVAEYWKRYDIRQVLQENWASRGPRLKGKLHIIIGAWDTYYLETGVEGLRAFLETTDYGGYIKVVPGDHGSFLRGRLADLDREMAAQFAVGERAFLEGHSSTP